MAETLAAGDAFLGGRLRIAQPEGGHRAGLDAVMLAAAAQMPAAGAQVLDAGTGAGVVGLCLASRVGTCWVTGVDIDQALVDLANDNARANGLEGRFKAGRADLTAPLSGLPFFLKPDAFDVVVANPPFYSAGTGTASSEPARARAAVMPSGGLKTWMRFMTAVLRPGGTLMLIYPAAALGDVLASLEGRCGAISVFPLYPRKFEAAHRVIVAGVKGSRAPLSLKAGLVLHEDGNAFTLATEDVLRNGAPLDIRS